MHVGLLHIYFAQVKHACLEIMTRQSHRDLSSTFTSNCMHAMEGLFSKHILALEHTLCCPFFILYL